MSSVGKRTRDYFKLLLSGSTQRDPNDRSSLAGADLEYHEYETGRKVESTNSDYQRSNLFK